MEKGKDNEREMKRRRRKKVIGWELVPVAHGV